jgi:hypothetical protein
MPLRWAIGMETTRAVGLSRDNACKLSKSVANFHRICSAMPGAVLCENGAPGV